RLAAHFDNGEVTAYNDTRVDVIAGVEGRFERWGNYAAYDEWAEEYTFVAGRSAAETQIGAGESVTVPAVVTNRTALPADGEVRLHAGEGFPASAPVPFTGLRPARQTRAARALPQTGPGDPGGTRRRRRGRRRVRRPDRHRPPLGGAGVRPGRHRLRRRQHRPPRLARRRALRRRRGGRRRRERGRHTGALLRPLARRLGRGAPR